MPNENKIEIICIIDRSGSMQAIRDDAEGGFNRFIEDQKKEPGECQVTLTQFDDKYEILFEAKPIKDMSHYLLVPRGNTALLDAMGQTINAVGERLAKTSEAQRPGKIVVVVVTDGQENASKEFRYADIKKLVTQQQETYKWQFVFQGANLDAFATSTLLGIPLRNVTQTQGTGASAKGGYQVLSRSLSNLRSAPAGASYCSVGNSVDEEGNISNVTPPK